ncbi:DMT family transporter [Microvirga alba]|uniref:DMT family transporter n=1 Tax=Microvirga alba TaxID=2791025 RepID=A0A931FMW8_9HYPH|nr:DMT family transporter [Microvirga alba]MBF9233030.1 DMT family transporter [Microvirga alba]
MASRSPSLGIGLSFVCLAILGVMPVISNGRPDNFDALSFACCLSFWQLLCSFPLLLHERRSAGRSVSAPQCPSPFRRRRTLAITLVTGAIFGLSTYMYVLAVEKAGAVSAAIAIQAYPLFAILWETLFLGRRKSVAELAFTALIILTLYYLTTNGTWLIGNFSFWSVFALGIPFLWSVAHVILKELLVTTSITPSQVTFSRVLISTALLLALHIVLGRADVLFSDLTNPEFQKFAFFMGLVYYLELIVWFYAVKYIDVSLASSITVPSPAVTMGFAVLFLNEAIQPYQLIAIAFIALGMYGLLFTGGRNRRVATSRERSPAAGDSRAPHREKAQPS